MIIGLTGANASGKGVITSILKEHYGFEIASLSDIVREEAAKKNIEPSRDNLIAIGNELRENYGAGVLAKLIKKRIDSHDWAIDSIRNPAEIEELRKIKGFKLIAVYAAPELRYKRESERKRAGFVKTFEEWLEIEKKENDSNPQHLQIMECIKSADYKIINDSTKDELIKKVEYTLNLIKEKQ